VTHRAKVTRLGAVSHGAEVAALDKQGIDVAGSLAP
jgi:hypothetical protein